MIIMKLNSKLLNFANRQLIIDKIMWKTSKYIEKKLMILFGIQIGKLKIMDKWIKVEDELPKKGEVVDVRYRGERETNYTYLRNYDGKKGNDFFSPIGGGFACLRDATHWRRLPKSPKKEQKTNVVDNTYTWQIYSAGGKVKTKNMTEAICKAITVYNKAMPHVSDDIVRMDIYVKKLEIKND